MVWVSHTMPSSSGRPVCMLVRHMSQVLSVVSGVVEGSGGAEVGGEAWGAVVSTPVGSG